MFEVEDIPSRHRQMVEASNRGDLPIGNTHRKSKFFAIAHQFNLDAGRGFILGKNTLVEGQDDETFDSLAKP